MSFQKCPACDGAGCSVNYLVDANYITNASEIQCPVCEGKKIINAETGKPPAVNNAEINSNFKMDDITAINIQSASKDLTYGVQYIIDYQLSNEIISISKISKTPTEC